jgi:hypothetical protein
MLDKFYSFVIDEIGFSFIEEVNSIIWLEYGDYKISIYNPIESKFEPRYSLEYCGKILSMNNNIRNYALDDLRILEIFRQEIRNNKLKKLGI